VRVFLDTNVWVAAFAARGLCEVLLEECLARHEVLTSALVWKELNATLTRKLAATPRVLKEIEALWQTATRVEDPPASHGESDARLLKAARDAGAEFFVTGDKAILVRGHHGGMPILTPRDMYERLIRGG
jgi:predicted nucleic acid-binding protein